MFFQYLLNPKNQFHSFTLSLYELNIFHSNSIFYVNFIHYLKENLIFSNILKYNKQTLLVSFIFISKYTTLCYSSKTTKKHSANTCKVFLCLLYCPIQQINAWRTVERDEHPLNRTSFFPSHGNHVLGNQPSLMLVCNQQKLLEEL